MKPAHRPFIEQCIADFGLQFRSEPGLSIIIPFLKARRGSAGDDDDGAGLNRAELLDAVIRNYFYPIIAGRLEVVVDAGPSADVAVVVNGDTIDRVMAELDLPETGEWSPPSYRRLFALCRASRSAAVECETLPAPPSANRSGYDAALLDGWRARYQAGEMLAFRIGADADARGSGRRQTGLRLYLQRDASLAEGQDYYVRGALSIHGGMDFIKRHRAACALLVVDEKEPLAAMLRDSEPPAHTVWNPNAGRACDNWVAAARRIRAVRSAPGNLLALMEAPTGEVQKDAFADIFFWDGGNGHNDGRRIREGSPAYQTGKPQSPRRPQEFAIVPIDGGFSVRLAEGIVDPPACARVRVAYDTPRGNPLNRYSPEERSFPGH